MSLSMGMRVVCHFICCGMEKLLFFYVKLVYERPALVRINAMNVARYYVVSLILCIGFKICPALCDFNLSIFC